MKEVTSVKETLIISNWKERVKKDERRIYAFILCADEHKEFRKYIRDAWQSLDKLSGDSCDVFTLERKGHSRDHIEKEEYLQIGDARIEGATAYDEGISQIDRSQCFEARDRLFENHEKIILPGIAVFTAAWERDAIYYCCNELDAEALNVTFQNLLNSAKEAYKHSHSSIECLELFKTIELERKIGNRQSTAVLSLSIMDVIDLVGSAMQLVKPKSKTNGA